MPEDIKSSVAEAEALDSYVERCAAEERDFVRGAMNALAREIECGVSDEKRRAQQTERMRAFIYAATDLSHAAITDEMCADWKTASQLAQNAVAYGRGVRALAYCAIRQDPKNAAFAMYEIIGADLLHWVQQHAQQHFTEVTAPDAVTKTAPPITHDAPRVMQ